MTTHHPRQEPAHGALGYVQLPTTDVAASKTFYENVFGWTGELGYASFDGPGLIGQWTTELAVATSGGPVLWLWVDDLGRALQATTASGGAVVSAPANDQGRRWLAEVSDPSGNRIGIVAAARTGRPQVMLAVRDVEVSSRWYAELLGLVSDHGGPDYERLLSDGVLSLQLHRREVEHHHGPVVEAADAPVGNGVLVWFGEVFDFDGAVARARALGAPIVREPHRNPPPGGGEGPSHRELWLRDPDGYVVVLASADGEAWESTAGA